MLRPDAWPVIFSSCLFALLSTLILCITNEHHFLCQNEKTDDCRFQFGDDLPEGSCVVFPTKMCRTMQMSTSPPLQLLESEDGAPFEASFTPFRLPRSGATRHNITLDIKDSGITGFFVFVQQEGYNSCRVFNFSGVREHLPSQERLQLYYDCYSGLDTVANHVYYTIFRAVPINEEIKYQTYVPSLQQLEPEDICVWVPVVMLNIGALAHRKVDLKFSPYNTSQNFDSYSVALTSDITRRVENVQRALPPGKRMHRVVFADLPGGLYQVTVSPNSAHTKCNNPKIVYAVEVHPDKAEVPFPWYLIIIFLFLLVALPVAGYIYKKQCKGHVLSRPKALLLYSEDCSFHMDVIYKFYEFLRDCCSIDIILDKWDLKNQSPDEWIPNMVQNVDFIIFVISKGVKHKVDENNEPEMIEKSIWGDLFLPAFRWLLGEISGGLPDHRLIKVVFSSYCTHTLTPRTLKNIGKTFNLMEDINSFLCHVHRQSVGCRLRQFVSVMPGSRYKTVQKGKVLKDAIHEMKKYQDENPDWFDKQLKPPRADPQSADNSPTHDSSPKSSIASTFHELSVLLPGQD